MTGDNSDNRPRSDRPRRGTRREPTVLDLTAEAVAVTPQGEEPASGEPTAVPADAMRAMKPGAVSPGAAPSDASPGHEQHPPALLPPKPFHTTHPIRWVMWRRSRPWTMSPGSRSCAPIRSQDVKAPSRTVAPRVTCRAPNQVSLSKRRPSSVLRHPACGSTRLPMRQSSTVLVRESHARKSSASPTSVPPASLPPPSSTTPPPRRLSPFVPALFGLVGGFVGAALLAGGFYLFGPAGDIGDRLTGVEAGLGERASRRTVEALEKRVAGLEFPALKYCAPIRTA